MAIIIDESVLDIFRFSPRCEWCGKGTPTGCHPAHVSARGMGGGKRIDSVYNVVALCHLCHHRQHYSNSNPSLEDLWGVIAKREKLTVDECKQKVWDMQRS